MVLKHFSLFQTCQKQLWICCLYCEHIVASIVKVGLMKTILLTFLVQNWLIWICCIYCEPICDFLTTSTHCWTMFTRILICIKCELQFYTLTDYSYISLGFERYYKRINLVIKFIYTVLPVLALEYNKKLTSGASKYLQIFN